MSNDSLTLLLNSVLASSTPEPSSLADKVWRDWMDYIESGALSPYQSIYQYGGKSGESLFTHVTTLAMSAIQLLQLDELDETAARVLIIALVVHDINKTSDEAMSFADLATVERISGEIIRVSLAGFFVDWKVYIEDIVALVRWHPGHYYTGGEQLLAPAMRPAYGLPHEVLETLKHLIRALDVLDLVKSMTHHTHQRTFLSHLNAAFPNRQFELHTHRLTENRGVFTNILHNSILEKLTESGDLIPLMLFPNGVVYLSEAGIDLPHMDVVWLANRIEASVNALLTKDVGTLIEQTGQGIKIKPDAIEKRVSFEALWLNVCDIIEHRTFKTDELEQKARDKAVAQLKKSPTHEGADTLQSMLDDSAAWIDATQSQLRCAEQARTFVIFLSTYGKQFSKDVINLTRDNAEWCYVCDHLHIEWDAAYSLIDGRYYLPYVLARHIDMGEDVVTDLFIELGTQLMESLPEQDATSFWQMYVQQHLLIDGQMLSDMSWGEPLQRYTDDPHRHCAYCGSAYETEKWMSADVRRDVKVQAFSNRLLGGDTAEPKRYVCPACRQQFLFESLTYPDARGENIYYLHLYPYSFLTLPFVQGYQRLFNRYRGSGIAERALNMDAISTMQSQQNSVLEPVKPVFLGRTNGDKPQPYGIYNPLYSEAIAGSFIFPLNPPADGNETERFLFALWYAMVLGRHMGMKVIMTSSPIAPLDTEHTPDLYIDSIPIAAQGLLPTANYYWYGNDGTGQPNSAGEPDGTLYALWERVLALFAVRRVLTSGKDNPIIPLVRAVTDGPLHPFYVADRMIEAKGQDYPQKLYVNTLPHLELLAHHRGGQAMAKLSEHMAELAAFARANYIKGDSWKRNSLLYPVHQIFEKLRQFGGQHDTEALIAATAQDIFDHIDRISDSQYKIGRNKHQAIEQYVRGWYALLDDVYGGKVQRMVSEEKLLRSTYLFYFQKASADAKLTEENQEE